jgi:hypothetical protein
MDNTTLFNLLELLKLDLGITHNLRDTYFSNVLESSANELSNMGVLLDYTLSEDQMLVVDYAAWTYRKRQENAPLARNLQFRINNRVIKKAGITDAIS